MVSKAFISCEYNEREYDEVNELCLFLQKNDVTIEFSQPSDTGWDFNVNATSAIEHSGLFIPVFSNAYKDATWQNVLITYALGLKKIRDFLRHPKPRIIGLQIKDVKPPSMWTNLDDVELLSQNKKDWGVLLEEIKSKY